MQRLENIALPRRYYTQDPALRFWAKVDRSGGPDACWPWLGYISNKGYGHLWQKLGSGLPTLAHCFAWHLTHGPIPSGMCVCHSCDVRYGLLSTEYRRCVNPAHLWLGTSAENQEDMVAKKRQGHRAGELHPNARLTEEIVRAIRQACDAGEDETQVAHRYGTSYTNVHGIVRRKSWKYVV